MPVARSHVKKPPTDKEVFKTTTSKVDEDVVVEAATKPMFDAYFLAGVMVNFGKLLTGVPIYYYQYVVIYRIFYACLTFEGAVLSVILSRQSGKSEAMAFAIDTLCVFMPVLAKVYEELEQYREGFRIGLFAPQQDQVWTTYNRAMLRLGTENADMVLSDPDINVWFESEVRLELSNGSYLKGQVAAKQSKIESKTYDLIIVEEAQDVDDYVIGKSIEPMLTATGGTMIKSGTTGTTKNHYWIDIQKNRNMDRKVRDERLYNHWEFNDKLVCKYRKEQFEIDRKEFHLRYEKFIRKQIDRYGEESQFFKLNYRLKWDLESGMLISDDDWNRITNKKKGFPSDYDDDDDIAMGLDIAKDVASTVMTIGRVYPYDEENPLKARVKEIVAWIELSGINYEAQHHLILEAIVRYNVKKLAGDYTGVGKAVIDRLMYACGDFVEIIPVVFSSQGKSELYYNFTSEIAARTFKVPWSKTVRHSNEGMRFEEQMKNCQKYFNGPYLICEHLEGFFDDYCDSAALMCWAGNHEGPQTYEVEEDTYNPFLEGLIGDRHKFNTNSY